MLVFGVWIPCNLSGAGQKLMEFRGFGPTSDDNVATSGKRPLRWKLCDNHGGSFCTLSLWCGLLLTAARAMVTKLKKESSISTANASLDSPLKRLGPVPEGS